MKKNSVLSIIFIFCLFFLSWINPGNNTIGNGKQPEIAFDSKGIVRVVFGRNDSIFCSTSIDKGEYFSVPTFVGYVVKMHLGMSRGPQLATSSHYSVITAMDEKGNITWFLLDHRNKKWINKGFVNDQRGSAPEGLMGLSADDKDHFYAVWLDLRHERQNNICFSLLNFKENKWSANKFIYRSPDGHTCECCKPNIAVRGNHLAIMFRNWLKGSRDLFIIESTNGGKTFANPEKLGTGTWKLNGCPMDGGSLTINKQDQVLTTWRREANLYFCKPQGNEILIDKGRLSNITLANEKVFCSYQKDDEVHIRGINQENDQTLGKGSFPKSLILPDQTVLTVWEKDQEIHFKKVRVPM